MPPPKPLPNPPAAAPRKRRLPQFSIFGLMVLMFVVSIGFSQMYYWSRAEARWARQKEREDKKRAAAELAKGSTPSTTPATANSPDSQTATPEEDLPDAGASDAPIATLMAIALPMLLMTILSVGYSLKKWLRRKPRPAR